MDLLSLPLLTLAQVKAASDIYAPVSGTIEAVNDKLNDEPSLLNKQPESDGESTSCNGIADWCTACSY